MNFSKYIQSIKGSGESGEVSSGPISIVLDSIRTMVWVMVFSHLMTGCGDVPSGLYPGGQESVTGHQLTVWMLSDIQPRNNSERFLFQQAIEDVNDYTGRVTLAVIAGDLLRSRSKGPAFEWFLTQRNRSKVPYWYEIAGNHDVRSGDIFYQYFPNPLFYGVEIGNITILLLSDQSVASKTEISDEAFFWWRKQVEENQDRIIVTVTHAHLRNSGLLGAAIKSRRIEGSGRFERVLRGSRVALWVSGHSHLPHGLAGTISIREKLRGTCFVNVSSIDSGAFMDSQSRFFIFSEDSDIVWIRSRNHTTKRFEPSLDYPVLLEKRFTWDGSPPRVLLPEMDK